MPCCFSRNGACRDYVLTRELSKLEQSIWHKRAVLQGLLLQRSTKANFIVLLTRQQHRSAWT